MGALSLASHVCPLNHHNASKRTWCRRPIAKNGTGCITGLPPNLSSLSPRHKRITFSTESSNRGSCWNARAIPRPWEWLAGATETLWGQSPANAASVGTKGLVVGPEFWEDAVLDDSGDPLGSVIWSSQPSRIPGESAAAASVSAVDPDGVVVRRSGEFNSLWIGTTLQSVVWAPSVEDPQADVPVFPYIRAMAAAAIIAGNIHQGPMTARQTPRVAALGVGGGALPMFLSRACPGLPIDAVELSAVVLEAAEQHMGLRLLNDDASGPSSSTTDQSNSSTITAHTEDALQWVQRMRESGGEHKWSAILLDCYDGDGLIPVPLRSRAFAESCKALLVPGGALVVNLYQGFENDLANLSLHSKPNDQAALKPFVPLVSELFESVFILRTPAQPQNMILVATSAPERRTGQEPADPGEELCGTTLQALPSLRSLQDATAKALAPGGVLPCKWQQDCLEWVVAPG